MILVTGATGNIGRKVRSRLVDRGERIRALSRDPSGESEHPLVTWVQGDMAHPESLRAAVQEVDHLFLLTGNRPNMVELQKNVISLAVAAGVEHVVKVSARGASADSESSIARWHQEVEAYIRDTDLAWTMLRPHVFMQNLLDQADRIRTEGTIVAASGDGRIPFIDTRDIADVAATTLTNPGHEGETYILTGGTALQYDQVAGALGAAIGRRVHYVAETMEEARTRMENEGVPEWLAEAKLALARYHRAGGPTARVTSDVYDVTGHPPRSIAQFAYDYQSEFTG